MIELEPTLCPEYRWIHGVARAVAPVELDERLFRPQVGEEHRMPERHG